MLEKIGFGTALIDFEKPYPELDLSQFDIKRTVLLFSSEPFPFLKKRKLIEDLPFSSAFVDGELYSWFGVRSLSFLEQLH